jgi:hypothetical protein
MKPGIWQTTRWHHSDVSIEAALLASDERLRMLGLTRDGKTAPAGPVSSRAKVAPCTWVRMRAHVQ